MSDVSYNACSWERLVFVRGEYAVYWTSLLEVTCQGSGDFEEGEDLADCGRWVTASADGRAGPNSTRQECCSCHRASFL